MNAIDRIVNVTITVAPRPRPTAFFEGWPADDFTLARARVWMRELENQDASEGSTNEGRELAKVELRMIIDQIEAMMRMAMDNPQ